MARRKTARRRSLLADRLAVHAKNNAICNCRKSYQPKYTGSILRKKMPRTQ